MTVTLLPISIVTRRLDRARKERSAELGQRFK